MVVLVVLELLLVDAQVFLVEIVQRGLNNSIDAAIILEVAKVAKLTYDFQHILGGVER